MPEPIILDSKYGISVWSSHDTDGPVQFFVVDRRKMPGRKFAVKVKFSSEREALKFAYSLIIEAARSV